MASLSSSAQNSNLRPSFKESALLSIIAVVLQNLETPEMDQSELSIENLLNFIIISIAKGNSKAQESSLFCASTLGQEKKI